MAKKKTDAEPTVEVLPILPEDSKIPALSLVPFTGDNQVIEFQGNFEAVKNALELRRDEVKKMKVSAKDMETVEKLKKEAQGYRIYLTETGTFGKRRFFNAPKAIYESKLQTLLDIVGEMESKAQVVLDKIAEDKRKELTGIFDLYKKSFQEKYSLSPEGLATIEYKPAYYNKTAKEKETKDDIEAQFVARRDVEKALALGEKTIRALCSGKPLLDVEMYVDELKGGKDLALIMDDISTEEARLAEASKVKTVVAEPVETPAPSSGSEETEEAHDADIVKVGVIGVASRLLGGGADFPTRTKKMQIELEYPSEFGSALSEIFQELSRYGIKSRNLGIIP